MTTQPPPKLKPITRSSHNDWIVERALALRPDGWFVVELPETIKRVPALRKRKANALASLIHRRVTARTNYRIVVSTRLESGDLLVLCKKGR